jgi:hypothetical protein
MPASLLLDKLKEAEIEVKETRKLSDGTEVKILVGTLPKFPTGERPTWYPLVLLPGQSDIDRREVEALLRHFWHFELDFFKPDTAIKHSRSVLKRK